MIPRRQPLAAPADVLAMPRLALPRLVARSSAAAPIPRRRGELLALTWSDLGLQSEVATASSTKRKVCLLARSAGLKGTSLHSLRHSHSSVLRSLGVPLPVVSKRLGHTTPVVTASIYSHAL